jgi:hypothetical protein
VHLVGDPSGKPCGEVSALLDDAGRPRPDLYAETRSLEVRFFDARRVEIREGAMARLVRVPQTAAWVAQTLLTPETIPRIAEQWNTAMLLHRDEIFALLTPIARDILLDVEKQIEAELPAFLERHEEEIRLLREDIERQHGGEKLTRLFEAEIWPLAQPRVRPIIEKVSREVWEALPIWGLTWRFAYQSLPFTQNDHLERAWVGFLEAQVAPIIKRHFDEMAQAAKEIARAVLANERVAAAGRAAFASVLEHPRFHALTQVFLQEVFLDNARFHEVLRDRFRSPAARRAGQVAATHLEPMLRRMGDILLGTREDGITREFARVLRAQILLKDAQRVVIDAGPPGAPARRPDLPLPASIAWDVKQ